MAKKNERTLRIILGCALVIVIVWAAILNFGPSGSSGSSASAPTASTSQSAAEQAAAQQLAYDSERFPRYAGKSKDPFIPVVVPETGGGSGSGGLRGRQGSWSLTGINSIDGSTQALIENGSGDSVFLKKGDNWNGLRVVAIESEDIVFENALGQKTTLGFSDQNEEAGPANTAVPASNSIPSINNLAPLPPLAPAVAVSGNTLQSMLSQPGLRSGRNLEGTNQ